MHTVWRALLPLIVSISAVAASVGESGCFDDNRFCLTLTERDGEWWVVAKRHTDLPVVITLYSPSIAAHHASVFLSDNQTYRVATLTNPNGFWDTMRVRWSTGVLNAKHNDNVRYLPPLTPIHAYPIVQGYNGTYSHTGMGRFALDFKAPVGTPVLAARAGVVVDTRHDSNRGGPDRSYGNDANFVAILHDDGTTGEYYHLRYNGVMVHRGEQVSAGQLIGYTGNTGFSSLPHLHFGVYSAREHGHDQSIPIQFSQTVPGFSAD